jgi:uncharacterized protein (TIGR02679 family)
VAIRRLDGALAERVTGGIGLLHLLELLDGPLTDYRAARVARRAAREAVWTNAFAHPAIGIHPQLADWLADLRSHSTLPAEPARRGTLLRAALDILAALPAEGISLSKLAADVLGRAHRLDQGALRRLVLRGLAHLAHWPSPPADAEEERHLWQQFGIALDDLASQVLVAGIRPPAGGALASALRAFADEGTPMRITLDQLTRHQGPFAASPGQVVSVCENPALLAAAVRRLGACCPALVCWEGVPSVAGRRLLRCLLNDETTVRYHGDYDWAGLTIAATAIAEGARPWHLNARDYQDAVEHLANRCRLPCLPARPGSLSTPWDTGLPETMSKIGLQVEEEHLIDDLVEDLAALAE